MTHYSPFANGRIVCSPVYPPPHADDAEPSASAHIGDVDCPRCLTARVSITCTMYEGPGPSSVVLKPTWRELHAFIRRIANEP